ncbi:MAG: GNAT family N-acetyltransferase [Anaerolineae bacterium]|nr:GNAT family N-acetyltransferase [Anaerolineae bacterium]
MPNTTIREISGDEMLDIMHGMAAYAFHPSPPLIDKDDWLEVARKRQGVTCIALFEDGAPVAMAANKALTQQVRGQMVGAGGVWNVMTHPSARRKGYARQVLAQLVVAIRESGQPLSCLYPFRESFYERLGYVAFPQPLKAILSPLALLPLLKQDLGGEVEMLLFSEGFEYFLDYLGELRRRIHGMAIFDQADRGWAERYNSWLALARVDGKTVGAMVYTIKGDRPTEFTLCATRFYYHTSRGRYLLLEWIARHADQANRVETWLPPFERPETWMPDMRLQKETDWFYPMGRVIDVAGIEGMPIGPGSFSARIDDPLCPWNNGVWRFESIDGHLQVSRTDQAECDLGIQALAALVYGTHDPDDFMFRGWGKVSNEAKAMMRSMFPPMQPYLHEQF